MRGRRVYCSFCFDVTSSLCLRLGVISLCASTYHTSNVSSCTPSSIPSSTLSPKQRSNFHKWLVSSWTKSWQYLHSARLPPNIRGVPQTLWTCWCGSTSCRLLISYILRTCNERRKYWIKFWSHNCCEGSFTPMLVLCNFWCARASC